MTVARLSQAKADVNLIDYDNLHVNHPELVHDLPAGMPRLMQTAKGYVATYVSGEAVQENGTGAIPRNDAFARREWHHSLT